MWRRRGRDDGDYRSALAQYQVSCGTTSTKRNKMSLSSRYFRFSACKPFRTDSRKTSTCEVMLHFEGRDFTVHHRSGTLTSVPRINDMRSRLAVFAGVFTGVFVFVGGFDSPLPESRGFAGGSCFALVPTPWARFFIAVILASGITWLSFRLRSTP